MTTNRTNGYHPSDFIEAGRAIRDVIRAELPSYVGKALDDRMEHFESRLAAAVAQVVQDQVVAQVKEECADLAAEMLTKMNAYTTAVSELAVLVSALKDQPAPSVFVPPEAIKIVVQLPPQRIVKSIEYNQLGRPDKIIETTEDA